jgi:hypothetical protein
MQNVDEFGRSIAELSSQGGTNSAIRQRRQQQRERRHKNRITISGINAMMEEGTSTDDELGDAYERDVANKIGEFLVELHLSNLH